MNYLDKIGVLIQDGWGLAALLAVALGYLYLDLRRVQRRSHQALLRTARGDPTTLGTLAIEVAGVAHSAVREAVCRQTNGDRMLLGAILVERGILTATQIEELLDLQRKLRSASPGRRSHAALELLERRTARLESELSAIRGRSNGGG